MATTRKGDDAGARVRLTVTLPKGLRERLGAFAGSRTLTDGDVVAAALEAHLRGFYFGTRASGSKVVPDDSAVGGDVLPIRTVG